MASIHQYLSSCFVTFSKHQTSSRSSYGSSTFVRHSRIGQSQGSKRAKPRGSEKVLVEPVLCSCTVGHITARCSRLDSDILLCRQTSWAQVGSKRKPFSSLCTAHSALVLRRFPLLHGSGASILGIGLLIYFWYCGTGISSGDGICSRSRDAETSAR